MERGLKLGKCILLNTLKLSSAVNRHNYLTRTVWRVPVSLPQKNYFSSIPNEDLIQFRSLEPTKSRDVDSKLPHLSKLSKFDFVNGFPKTFFFKRNPKKNPNKKRVPKLILLQNPFTWLMTKIDFRVLRHIWDPSFREKDFMFGTRQAISRVTNVISQGQYAELSGLLTKPARSSLMRELERNWNDRQRSLLALKPEDIQISSPRKVYFIRIAVFIDNGTEPFVRESDSHLAGFIFNSGFSVKENIVRKPTQSQEYQPGPNKKYCDVDMSFLALKWVPINSVEALIFAEVFARFHREYTPHCIPEWTIAYFKVTRFQVLRRQHRD